VTGIVVGVVGAGTMGTGIAQVCLEAGNRVRLFDPRPGAVDRARDRIAARLGDGAIARLTLTSSLEKAARDSQIVIEAAIEDLTTKQAIFRKIDAAAPAGALLTTNTSALPVTRIAAATTHPDRVVGLHFFNPAPIMALVEVVAGELSGRAHLRQADDFARQLGKTPVTCHDSPGFIVNRINRPFTLEALRLVESSRSTVTEVDHALESAGYPMGPFRLMDLVGIDVNLSVARALYTGFREAPRFRPSSLQVELVEAGRLGRKTGSGFYRYGADGRPTGVEPLGKPRRSLPPDAIVERIELAIVNEAYRAVGEQLATPADIDLAMRLGARHTAGPFEVAGRLGLRRVVTRLRELQVTEAAVSGDQFEVAPTLWQVATV
jgi:3-hydroxybutyryl-CoA dehydrogenase